jgi:hypothetical protein
MFICAKYMINLSDPTEEQTEDGCLIVVVRNGMELEYVKNQTDAICICAVRQNGRALKYVKNQTEAICICAVKNDGWALKYVKNQTGVICIKAVRQNAWALEYVERQTDAICMEALTNWHQILVYSTFYNIYNFVTYPSPQLITQLLKIYPSYTCTIMTEYVINLMKTYKTGSDAIKLYLVRHATDLLYRPNNVNALLCHTKWHTISDCSKTIFLKN